MYNAQCTVYSRHIPGRHGVGETLRAGPGTRVKQGEQKDGRHYLGANIRVIEKLVLSWVNT